MSTTEAGAAINPSSTTANPSWTPAGGTSVAADATEGIVTSTLAAVVDTMKAYVSSTTTSTTSTTAATTTTSPAAASSTPQTLASSMAASVASSVGADSSTSTHAPQLTVADLTSSMQRFGYIDYAVFVLMLLVCAVIGFYFGFIEKKQKGKGKHGVEQRRGSEALDYLVGGRKMKVFPVSLSLVASFVSGISLLGTSTEIYVYGTQYAFVLITLAISGVISWYVFLPVFCNLQLTSTYEYLELRFDKRIRLVGSILFTFAATCWLPIVIYVPALAFNQVTGVNIHAVTPVVCIVCIFYTSVGGIKAVVWTDVVQTVVMVGAIIFVVIKGTINVGGLNVVWERNYASGRIELPAATWDPTVRCSWLSIFLGSTLYYVQNTCGNQVIMQRFLTLPGLKQVKSALIWYLAGVIALTLICFYNGMLIYATYYDCDPLSTKLAAAKDQLVPVLVMDTLNVIPGMSGVFVAGVFSAALSSLSTGLNSLAAVFLEDYVKPLRKTALSEFQTAVIMRSTVVIMGIVCVGLVFVVEKLGMVFQLSMTVNAVTTGPLLGIFLMGLLLPWINSKSAITGSMLAFPIMTWICVKAQLAQLNHELVYEEKPVSTEGCTYIFEPVTTPANATLTRAEESHTLLENIYHMSFLFYVGIGAILTVLFAALASFVVGRNDPSKMDPALFSPFIRKYLKSAEYISVQADEKTVINGLDLNDLDLKNPQKS